MTGVEAVRHVILQTAMGGAAVMLLLTVGLLFLRQPSKAAVRPTAHRVPPPPAAPEPEAPEPAVPEPAAPPGPSASPLWQSGDDDQPAQRHEVALGDDRIEVVLASTAASSRAAPAGSYLRWAPLPYDVPEDGLAFACIGAGDQGCLFVDLAAAPGAVAITGDPDATIRLAESIVHQLCTSAAAGQAISVLVVGSSVPEPHPANATSVPTLSDLAAAGLRRPPGSTDIVFCELRSDEDAVALARDVASSGHRIVPVVLGPTPSTAWSFTATHSGC